MLLYIYGKRNILQIENKSKYINDVDL